jgi:hypothetical protein
MSPHTKDLVEKSLTTALVFGLIIFAIRASKPLRKVDKKTVHPSDHLPDWDRVDEASWESFPASDAPGHY